MKSLLLLSRAIDWVNDRLANLSRWAVLLACVISAVNALVRYGFDYSSNAYLEIQWYLFAACVMLGAAQVLRVNEHVRVDLIYGRLSGHGKVWTDLLGLLLFLLPSMLTMLYFSWPLFVRMFQTGEMSSNAGGLIRWPAMLLLPVGFAMVFLQGISETIKRIGWLTNQYEMDTHYERPLQ